jgi:hypothetical protein
MHSATNGRSSWLIRAVSNSYHPLGTRDTAETEVDSDDEKEIKPEPASLSLTFESTLHPRYSSPQLNGRLGEESLASPAFLLAAEKMRNADESSDTSSNELNHSSSIGSRDDEEEDDEELTEDEIALRAMDSDDDSEADTEAPVVAAANADPDAHVRYKRFGKILGKTVISLIASGANAINAMMNPSNKQPKDISWEWVESLSPAQRADAIWNFCASLLVNFILAYDSIPAAFYTLKKSVTKEHKTQQEKIDLGVTITLGLFAAVASAAISYGAFTWLNPAVAELVAFGALLINFTTRYVGVKNLGNRARSGYDKDTQAIHQFIRDMNNIKPDYQNITEILVKQSYAKAGDKMNDKTIAYFANRMFILRRHWERKNEDIIHADTRVDKLRLFTLKGMTISFASIVGLASLTTFDQKGFDGLNKITGGFMENLPGGVRGFIGFPPGAATAMLYAVSALDAPKRTVNTMRDLAHDREAKKIALFLFLAIANFYASGSMENVCKGAMQRSDWIFNFLILGTLLGQLVVYLNRAGGGATNTNASFKKFFSAPAPTTGRLRDVVKYLDTKDITERLTTKPQALINRWLTNPTKLEEVKVETVNEAHDPASQNRRHRHDTEQSSEGNGLLSPRNGRMSV